MNGNNQGLASQSDRQSREGSRLSTNKTSRKGEEAAVQVSRSAQISVGAGQADRGQGNLREEEGSGAVIRDSGAARLGQE